MNKFGNEYVDKYIKKNVNKNTVSYNVFIWRHDLQVNERFETLEKAKAFRDEALRLCELKRIESIRAGLEITDYPYNLINALEFDVAYVNEGNQVLRVKEGYNPFYIWYMLNNDPKIRFELLNFKNSGFGYLQVNLSKLKLLIPSIE